MGKLLQVKAPLVKHLSQLQSEPDTWLNDPSNVDMSCPDAPTHIKRFFPGVNEFQVGSIYELWIKDRNNKKIPGVFIGENNEPQDIL